MFTACWSVKGGVGTSVVAAALAIRTADLRPVSIVDCGGDQAAIFGVAEPDGPGLAEWTAAGDDVPVDSVVRLAVPINDRIDLYPRGVGPIDEVRLGVLIDVLAATGRDVVVDAGVIGDPEHSSIDNRALESRARLVGRAERSILVLRPCYLTLRRLNGSCPDAEVVLIDEPARALRGSDVMAVAGVDHVVRVPWDPAVARAVDAGLLLARLPMALRKIEARP